MYHGNNEPVKFTIDGKWGLVDIITGKIIIEAIWDFIGYIHDGFIPVGLGGFNKIDIQYQDCLLGGKYGYIDLNGEVIIPLEYDEVSKTSYDGYFKVRKDKEIYIIDRNNIIQNNLTEEDIIAIDKSMYYYDDKVKFGDNTRMKETLEDMLLKEFRSYTRTSDYWWFELPEGYDYYVFEDILYLNIKNPNENTHSNDGSFDGWAVGIKRWIKGINKIVLSWEKPKIKKLVEYSNYQRFLYRVKKSITIHDWLEVYERCQELLDDLNTVDNKNYEFCFTYQKSENKLHDSEEVMVEMFTDDYSDCLGSKVGIDQEKIYRQPPITIYNIKKSLSNEILALDNSAITNEIWGLNKSKDELHLFELQANYNKTIGVYSQLFLYTMIQDDIINGVFKYYDPEKITDKGFEYLTEYEYNNLKNIKAHLLVEKLHPMIDSEMIDLVNESLKSKGKNIEFNIIKYDFDFKTRALELG